VREPHEWDAGHVAGAIHVPLGDTGRVVVCKLDAVFERGDRFEIVDWKTGAVPTTPEDVRNASFQLALYRLAYAHHREVDPERIDAVLYYVSHDVQLRPERLYSEEELPPEFKLYLPIQVSMAPCLLICCTVQHFLHLLIHLTLPLV
jgi:hypothetical protein